MNTTPELELRELKALTTVIKDVWKDDFSEMAFASFKRRVEKLMLKKQIASADELVKFVKDYRQNYDEFVTTLSIDNTELFRDPSFWRSLRNELRNLSGTKLNIWLPQVASGEELYSLCILLKEKNMYQDCAIIASDFNEHILASAKKGIYPQRHIETWQNNYERLESGGNLTTYYTRPNQFEVQLNPELLQQVTFKVNKITGSEIVGKFDLIIYRNQLIYFNSSMQEKVCKTLMNNLKTRGLLAIGFKENIQSNTCYLNLAVVSEEEKIYRKLRD